MLFPVYTCVCQTEEQYVISVSVYTCVYSMLFPFLCVLVYVRLKNSMLFPVYSCVCQTEEQYVISVSVCTCVCQTEEQYVISCVYLCMSD